MAAKKKISEKQALDACHLARLYVQDNNGSDAVAKEAFDVLNANYWADVRGCAADFLKQAKNGDFKNDEELTEQFQQYVDGAQNVIYTFWARITVLCTNNPDAYEDEFGEAPKDDSQRAYASFMADIAAHPDMEEAFSIARGDDE